MGARCRCLFFYLLLITFLTDQLGISRGSATKILLRCRGWERKALLEFKRLLHDPSNRLSSWVGEECCGGAWEGVGCSNITGHVIKLDLRNRNCISPDIYRDDLSGSSPYDFEDQGCKQSLLGDVSSSLISLQHLTHLDLSGNYFGHPIPAFLGSLPRLKYLNLSSAGFIGRVPEQLGNLSNLGYLDLSYNSYHYRDDYGDSHRFLNLENSEWISRLSSLRLINMSRVNFASSSNWLQALNALPLIQEVQLAYCELGAFPLSLPHSNFTSLTTLNLRYNSIYSIVPDWLLNITTLECLELGKNYIYWNAPVSLAELTSLKALDLSANVFSDNFSYETLMNLCMLQRLYLTNVAINDVLSKLEMIFSGCLMFSLEELELGGSNLNGSLPHWLGSMKNLKYLDLSYNSLHGSLPPWLGNVKNLKHLDLYSNSFYGPLPESLGNLSSLQYLRLSNNKFNGTITQGIQLDGSFSDWLGNMKNLELLDLSYNSFYGPLPASLGNLSSLRYLSLSHNNFNGTIARGIQLDGSFSNWLGNMESLEILDLSCNSIYGSLPPFLGKKLKMIDLSYNSFYGSLSLGNLSSLQNLNIFSNNLNGSIEGILQTEDLINLDLGNNSLYFFETQLANLSSLKYLDISYNTLVLDSSNNWIPQFQLVSLDMSFCRIMPISYFPHWLQTQTSLLDLSMESIGIKGMRPYSLPPSLEHLYLSNNEIGNEILLQYFPNLTELSISDNSLYGQIPKRMEDMMPNLQHLNLSHNKLTGDVPLIYFPNLKELSMSNNSLSGKIPQGIEDMMPNLEDLDLSYNKLTGEVPSLYFPKLRYLDISNNLFLGHIPLKISPNLILLDLSMNNLSGSIPWSFCQIEFWVLIQLSNNNLSGEIPNCWNNLSKAFILDFSSNHLQGKLPDTLCNMWSLRALHLSHNKLSGEIPLSLRNCTKLVTLDLGYNNFTGNVPTWLEGSLPHLKTLNLRFNAFTGHIPRLSHLAYLQILDISNNHISGDIPYYLGNFTAMKSSPNGMSYFKENDHDNDGDDPFSTYDDMWLFIKGFEFKFRSLLSLVTIIDLSNNNLSGYIPRELGNLQGLQNLNLSGNYLVGGIPESIGKIKRLETLDLSRNNLSGAIPMSMIGLSFLNHLNLSYNNFSGRIPTGNQFQTFNDPSIYDGNPYLCGLPLTESCTEDTPRSNTASDEDGWGRMETIWLYSCAALGFIMGFWSIWGILLLNRSWRILYYRAIDDAYDNLLVTVAVNMGRIKTRIIDKR